MKPNKKKLRAWIHISSKQIEGKFQSLLLWVTRLESFWSMYNNFEWEKKKFLK